MKQENLFEGPEKTMHTANTEISKIADKEKEDKVKNSNPTSSTSNEENWIEKAFMPEFLKWADKYSKGDKALRLQLIRYFNGVYVLAILLILSAFTFNLSLMLMISITLFSRYLNFKYLITDEIYTSDNREFRFRDGLNLEMKRGYITSFILILVGFIIATGINYFNISLFFKDEIVDNIIYFLFFNTFLMIFPYASLIYPSIPTESSFQPKAIIFNKIKHINGVYIWK